MLNRFETIFKENQAKYEGIINERNNILITKNMKDYIRINNITPEKNRLAVEIVELNVQLAELTEKMDATLGINITPEDVDAIVKADEISVDIGSIIEKQSKIMSRIDDKNKSTGALNSISHSLLTRKSSDNNVSKSIVTNIKIAVTAQKLINEFVTDFMKAIENEDRTLYNVDAIRDNIIDTMSETIANRDLVSPSVMLANTIAQVRDIVGFLSKTGCTTEEGDELIAQFVESMNSIIKNLPTGSYVYDEHQAYWKRCSEALDGGTKHITDMIDQTQIEIENGEPVTSGLFHSVNDELLNITKQLKNLEETTLHQSTKFFKSLEDETIQVAMKASAEDAAKRKETILTLDKNTSTTFMVYINLISKSLTDKELRDNILRSTETGDVHDVWLLKQAINAAMWISLKYNSRDIVYKTIRLFNIDMNN